MAMSSPSALGGDRRFLHALDSGATASSQAGSAATAKSIQQASKQFEALFMQQLMKSMREATVSTGMLDNAGTQMGTEMLDTQYANQMTGMPGGLGDLIAKQLARQMGQTPDAPTTAAKPSGATPAAAAVPVASAAGAPQGNASVSQRQSDFLRQHQEAAKAAEAQTGIPATFMVAQAAHESGWGKHEIKNRDGSGSHNLFGIKAGPGWTGPVASVTTTEVINGEPRKVTAKFRAYGSYAESFRDYAQLMKDNPRYAKVVAANNSADGFAHGLQRAGYATDPAYAAKLTRVINTTLRLQRAMVA
jgi:flagellar protein FlgJ